MCSIELVTPPDRTTVVFVSPPLSEMSDRPLSPHADDPASTPLTILPTIHLPQHGGPVKCEVTKTTYSPLTAEEEVAKRARSVLWTQASTRRLPIVSPQDLGVAKWVTDGLAAAFEVSALRRHSAFLSPSASGTMALLLAADALSIFHEAADVRDDLPFPSPGGAGATTIPPLSGHHVSAAAALYASAQVWWSDIVSMRDCLSMCVPQSEAFLSDATPWISATAAAEAGVAPTATTRGAVTRAFTTRVLDVVLACEGGRIMGFSMSQPLLAAYDAVFGDAALRDTFFSEACKHVIYPWVVKEADGTASRRLVRAWPREGWRTMCVLIAGAFHPSASMASDRTFAETLGAVQGIDSGVVKASAVELIVTSHRALAAYALWCCMFSLPRHLASSATVTEAVVAAATVADAIFMGGKKAVFANVRKDCVDVVAAREAQRQVLRRAFELCRCNVTRRFGEEERSLVRRLLGVSPEDVWVMARKRVAELARTCSLAAGEDADGGLDVLSTMAAGGGIGVIKRGRPRSETVRVHAQRVRCMTHAQYVQTLVSTRKKGTAKTVVNDIGSLHTCVAVMT